MKKFLLFLAASFVMMQCVAADIFTLKGSVRDRATSSYIINAKVECINDNDSVVGEAWAISYDYDYRRRASVQKGIFWMEIPKQKGHYTLRFTHEEYDTITAPLDLTKIGPREFDREIGVYYMDKPKVHELKEVEVTASKIMFYNRGDTIVFNADAFQLAEGSMLDALIEQLPGVELREGGQIYVNGKFVKSLLLNGKDFFKGDNQVMLDNLAAYTVKNIEVYKKQTDRARFLGLDDEENKELVMDVKLKKEYIGGWTINAEAAGGTEDRYMARLFAMNFSALSQFTLIGNANNLNDESRPTAEDQWDPERMEDGELRHQQAGFDYNLENELATRKASGNVVFENQRSLYENVSNTTNFMPGQSIYGNGISSGLNRDFNLSSRHELYYQTSGVALKFNPGITWSHGRNSNYNESDNARDENHESLINRSLSESFGTDSRLGLNGNLTATIKVPHTSDAIDVYTNFNYSANKSERESYNIIRYGDASIVPDARRQLTDNDPTHSLNFAIGTSYNLILNSKFNASFNYDFDCSTNTNTSSYYLGRLEAGYTGDYTLANLYNIKMSFDPTNSNVSDEKSNTHNIKARFTWKPNKNWEISAGAPLSIYSRNLLYRQDGKEYAADYKATLPNGASLSVEFSNYDEEAGMTAFDMSYSRYYNLPSLSNMITLPNTRDPLSTYVGNPDLKPSAYDQVYGMFQTSTRHNFTAYIYGQYTSIMDAITNGYSYDAVTGKRTYMAQNVDGDWRMYSTLYLSWYEGRHNWNISLQASYNHTCTHSMVGYNGEEMQPITMHSNIINPSIRVQKFFGPGRNKYISFMAQPTLRYNKSTDINANIINPIEGKYRLSGKYEFPYGWSLSTSLSLTTRSGYDNPEMERNEWIWNGRITKTLLKGKLMASIIAYDLLHQHNSYQYYVTSNMQTEYFTNTIPRYILFDLQYKINIQPKKKIAQTTHYY